MVKIPTVLVFLMVFLYIPLFGSNVSREELTKFHYEPYKALTGAFFHYVKTNQDGSEPLENITIYVASADRLEVFKYRDPGTRAALVIASYDWNIFSVRKLESYQVFSSTESKLIATLEYDLKASTATARVFLGETPPETVSIPGLPFHVYNFDFTSLNFSMRFLKNPKGSFIFDVADLVSRDGEWHFVNRGPVSVQYITDEIVHDQTCRKYSINGEGLENRGGFLWLNEGGGYAEKIQIDLPDNPDWQSFLLELKETRKMTDEEWRKFREAHFAAEE